MKTRNLITVVSFLVLCSCAPQKQPEDQEAQHPEKAKTEKKAVFILVDGIPADVIESVPTPNLDAISKLGGYARIFVGGEKGSYNETPTISSPGYMNLLTSTWANKHNVWDNYDQKPNYHYWNIFRVLETVKPEASSAIFSTWEDNRTILVGEGAENAGDFQIDYAFDGFEKDTLRFPHDQLRNYIAQIDSIVVDETARYLQKNGPDLSWVYLEYTDDVGHGLGDSPYFYSTVQKADKQIGKIWAAVEKRMALGEDWMIVITTDHGRDSVSGKDHGGQTERERITWMVTNKPALNERFSSGSMSILDISPSILDFMGIEIPTEVRYEMDGTSFMRSVSVDSLRAVLTDEEVILKWKAMGDPAEAKILATFTNNYKTGGVDEYELLGVASSVDADFRHQLSAVQKKRFEETKFLKVVLETENHVLNRWILKE